MYAICLRDTVWPVSLQIMQRQTQNREFLNFVDSNSQPNGRYLDSHNPTHYFLPTFTTITTPKRGVRDYENKLQTCVAGVCNHLQLGCGEPTISKLCSLLMAESRTSEVSYISTKVTSVQI